MDYVAQTASCKHEAGKVLDRIEGQLNLTTDQAHATAFDLVKQGEQINSVQQGMGQVKDDLKRTHKLLDKFAKWSVWC